MKQILYKVPNGKMLRIFLEKENDKIVDIKITGDFFVYPEEKISLIEANLRGKALNKDELVNDLNKVIESESLELFGVNAESIVTALFL
jgi:lipoate-protein ligase A